MRLLTACLIVSLLLPGCGDTTHKPLPTAQRIELPRFMGDWYVIASIPTFLERCAYDAMESYRLNRNGAVEATFSFREGGFNGALRRYHSVAYIRDKKSNAVWEMQFLWPFKSDYRVMYLASDYSATIVGRVRRDYVWIMARSPRISDRVYERLVRIVADAGYDTEKLQRIQQRIVESTL